MIIDCHGHYTTAPAELGEYRDTQKAELKKGPPPSAREGYFRITDDQIRESLEGAPSAARSVQEPQPWRQ